MESTPQPSVDRIWSRILFFAMLSLEQHPDNTQPWQLDDQKSSSTQRLASILLHTCNLTRLTGDFSSIPLAKIAGSTITEFTGVILESALPTHSPMIFSTPFFDPRDQATVVALPALEFLCMKSPQALPLFSKMLLPSLRRASFELIGDWDTTLLKTHGAKLQHLQVDRTTIAKQSVLTPCPNITTLTCNVYAHDNYDFGGSTLSQTVVDECQWERLFLTPDVSHLPALREVCIPSLDWPMTEIANNVWVEGEKILLVRGIKLTDEAGTRWRPRLKASRGKGG
ncbi:hypothetical protein DFH09DRAFT_1317930 [Mycena vulgaris]|nr:hypothetical protein DFH09DRAFT_1317930 [Mycena vulgaris]